jgi:hypothetical protein
MRKQEGKRTQTRKQHQNSNISDLAAGPKTSAKENPSSAAKSSQGSRSIQSRAAQIHRTTQVPYRTPQKWAEQKKTRWRPTKNEKKARRKIFSSERNSQIEWAATEAGSGDSIANPSPAKPTPWRTNLAGAANETSRATASCIPRELWAEGKNKPNRIGLKERGLLGDFACAQEQ